MTSPDDKSSASNSTPSVDRINFAFALTVAGLALSSTRVFVTSPISKLLGGYCFAAVYHPDLTY